MGPTLFRYLLRDLLRIFFLSAIGLAGIMSFGGLLQPLTKNGLDSAQVIQMWLFLMPAMMTYSLPVAAVFAASIVYGRLAADNELTACRAVGLSYRSILAPAMTMGIIATFASLIFLSFVVPFFSYQVERVIYSNVAKVIANDIQASHRFDMGRGKPVIFAQQAYIPPSSGSDGEQVVVLEQPMIVSQGMAENKKDYVPRVFSLAREATLFIRQGPNNEVVVSGVLKGATSFARSLGSRPQVGVGDVPVGPITMASPLRQNPKFMDVSRLKQMAGSPELAARVQDSLKAFHDSQQRIHFYQNIIDAVYANPASGYINTEGDYYQIIAPSSTWAGEGNNLVFRASSHSPITLRVKRNNRLVTCQTNQLRLFPDIDNEYHVVILAMTMTDVIVTDGNDILHKPTLQEISTSPIPDNVRQIRQRKVSDYLPPGTTLDSNMRRLARARVVSINEVMAEMHSRASFGLSCLVLVLVGSVLGMQFRSGDFLSAFAVSFIPAILTITLVVAGSQTAVQVNEASLNNPLPLGLGLIWAGNIIAAILALILFLRIRRT